MKMICRKCNTVFSEYIESDLCTMDCPECGAPRFSVYGNECNEFLPAYYRLTDVVLSDITSMIHAEHAIEWIETNPKAYDCTRRQWLDGAPESSRMKTSYKNKLAAINKKIAKF